MKKFFVFLAAMLLLAGGGIFCSDDEEDEKAYVRFHNNTGSTMANISGAGATWVGPYIDDDYTEQKEVDTGNHNVTWTCGGNPYNKYVDVEEGSWLLRINDCAAVSVTTIEE